MKNNTAVLTKDKEVLRAMNMLLLAFLRMSTWNSLTQGVFIFASSG